MHLRLIKAMLLLPGLALVLIPGALLLLSAGGPAAANPVGPDRWPFWLALPLFLAGLSLAIWTVRLQLVIGRGTPAPWDPTQKLVVAGPYRHVRNPMMSGAFLMLLAAALLTRSPALAAWFILFVALNLLYIPLVEEKRLAARFGQQYRRYQDHVPRWIPRLRPWTAEQDIG